MEDKIPFKPIKLSKQNPTKIGDCYIELFDDKLHYKCDFTADEPSNDEDLAMGWIAVANSIDRWVKKSFISGVEKSISYSGKWHISILVAGNDDIHIYYNSETSSQILFDRLVKWLFNL